MQVSVLSREVTAKPNMNIDLWMTTLTRREERGGRETRKVGFSGGRGEGGYGNGCSR